MIKVNGEAISIIQFPNGESLIKSDFINNKYLNSHLNISLKFEDDRDLMHLVMIKNFIDDGGYTADLNIPYFPYSRMDRTEGKNVFTLKSVAKLINSLNFKRVYTLEPHSDVSVALLDRVNPYNMSVTLLEQLREDKKEVLNIDQEDYLVFPDAGAEKRYSKQVSGVNILTAIKNRDFETGYITSLDIVGEVPNKPFKAVIIDDLCSKGGTFLLTANKLKELGATEIYLIVTHCENTIFDGELLKDDSPISEIYTTNSILSDNITYHNQLHIKGVF